MWWRIASRLASFEAAQVATMTSADKLRLQVGHSAKRVNESLDMVFKEISALKTEMATFSVLLNEREKDIARLEGGLDQLSALVVKNVAALQGASASVDALWRSLRNIHPDKIPKRASDRG